MRGVSRVLGDRHGEPHTRISKDVNSNASNQAGMFDHTRVSLKQTYVCLEIFGKCVLAS